MYQKPKGNAAAKGPNQPPKKNSTIMKDNTSILPYSPKKNNAKVMLEYSTLNPATSSASAYGKSKGVRLVSANIETKKAKHSGRSGKINQPACC